MQVKSSAYLASMKPLYRKLLDACLAEYGYASVLAADVEAKDYSVSRAGISVSENNRFGRRGFVVRVYQGEGYAEYSGNELSEEKISGILAELKRSISKAAEKGGTQRLASVSGRVPREMDTPITKNRWKVW